jgi:pyruvate dehydrogenase E1 component
MHGSHPADTLTFDAEAPSPLLEIETRLLWLATSIIHHANRVRPNPSGLKVGGHRASCASMVSIVTSLWFEPLQPGDRVSVKPHASTASTSTRPSSINRNRPS